MNIIIQSVNFKPRVALKNFVREKVGKLFKQYANLESATVILRKGENGNLENKSCEIRLAVPGNDPVVKKSTDVYEKSVLQVVETLQKVLRRKKDRQIARRQPAYQEKHSGAMY